MIVQLQHPSIGQIRGIGVKRVSKYLCISYGSLKHKFADPVIREHYTDAIVDATSHGPCPISPPDGCKNEFGFIQHELPCNEFSYSSIDCLNLNVFVPESESSSLPVFVFFHGGGFAVGSSNWPQYDLSQVVRSSASMHLPVIGVSVNYRLGALGFLHSVQLQQIGINANRGLRDQRTALEWIQRHIAGFGGDSNNVTIIGESAGGVSCMLHLDSTKKLFNQVIAMSGNFLVMKPLPQVVSEFTFAKVLDILAIDKDLDAEAKLQALLNVSDEQFLSKIPPGLPLFPVVDSDSIQTPHTYHDWTNGNGPSSLSGLSWCLRLMIGDCQHDASIFDGFLNSRSPGLAKEFGRTVNSTLPDDAQALLTAYNISDNDSDQDAKSKIIQFASDIVFDVSATIIARAWKDSSFRYYFNEPNPWHGPYKGKSTHILDVAFLFQNFNDFLSPPQRAAAQLFLHDFILFVNGKDPYPVFSSDQIGGARIYDSRTGGEGATFCKTDEPEDFGRSKTIWELGSTIGFDRLAGVWDKFLSGQ